MAAPPVEGSEEAQSRALRKRHYVDVSVSKTFATISLCQNQTAGAGAKSQ